MDHTLLRSKMYTDLLDLATDDGINASGRDEIYGCIFGRDSAITILKILNVTAQQSATSLYEVDRLRQMCRRALLTLVSLQGKESIYASGEEPGKFIHEYRKERYEHLLKLEKPWYVYPDGVLRNYDSLDSTPLALLAIYRYWKQTRDDAFLFSVLPAVESGLNWIITYGDRDKDQLVEYELPADRPYGGLPVQSWTDSHESLMRKDGTMPVYPIAPVEVQGYTWLALKVWADFYADSVHYAKTESFSRKLLQQAETMKKRFNELFLFDDGKGMFSAQALDGEKNQIRTITGNSLLLLWATYESNGHKEAILADEYIPHLVERSFLSDLFDQDAGIRTMSTLSETFNPAQDSYHNGSFWPKLNGMCHEGLMHWGYREQAAKLKEATLKPISYFGSPIELYMKGDNGEYYEFHGPTGQTGCRVQAWSAATALELLTQ
jgi:glycogen debranching enzyme